MTCEFMIILKTKVYYIYIDIVSYIKYFFFFFATFSTNDFFFYKLSEVFFFVKIIIIIMNFAVVAEYNN